MQFSFRAHREDTAVVDHGARSRPVVVAVPIFERGGISELPLRRSGLWLQTHDDFLILDPMDEHEALTSNSW
jgi:hypothetical protein